MVGRQLARILLAGASILMLLGFASCSDIPLLNVIRGMAGRDALGPIKEVYINAAGDSFLLGDPTLYVSQTSQTISASFHMSKYEITNAQFKQFMDDGGYTTESYWTANGWKWRNDRTVPGDWTSAGFNAPNQPVTGVNWYEAVAFCNWRSTKEYLTPAYDKYGKANLGASGYRLPTEVEWEYAAAKGGPGEAERIYAYGDTFDPSRCVQGVSSTEPVGSRSGAGGDTPQGLADMTGNAEEWCSDIYTPTYPPVPTTDFYNFTDDQQTSSFVARGGSWDSAVEPNMRCAYRLSVVAPTQESALHIHSLSFRTVRR